MRVDLNSGIGQAAEASQSAAGAKSTAAGASAGSRSGDTAQLSTDQARVQSLLEQVNAVPEIRREKVAALGKAVREGTYQVEPEQTADALIDEMFSRSAA